MHRIQELKQKGTEMAIVQTIINANDLWVAMSAVDFHGCAEIRTMRKDGQRFVSFDGPTITEFTIREHLNNENRIYWLIQDNGRPLFLVNLDY